MRHISFIAAGLLFGVAACASSGTTSNGTAPVDDGASGRTVQSETFGSTTVTVDSDRPVEVYHHHYPVQPGFAGQHPSYGFPPRNYHTHAGAAVAPQPQPQPQPQPMIDYGAASQPPPQQFRSQPAPTYGYRHYNGRPPMGAYTGAHMGARMTYVSDYHNRQPYPRPDSAGIGPAEVAEAQHNLAQLGFHPGPVDGVYGPRTRRAVMAYTSHQGMPTDGRVTHSVLTYLRSDIAERIRPPSVNEQHGPYFR